MARQTLVLDASVGVKWFSARGEQSLPQALQMRDGHVAGDLLVLVPDLFYYEVANAIVHKKDIPARAVQSAVASLFALGLQTVPVETSVLETATGLARRLNITVYDACYIAVAKQAECPLVTANPRHQAREMGCHVIPVEEWRPS